MMLGRSPSWIRGAFYLVSLTRLLLLFAATTSLWRIYVLPDVWSGAGHGKAEWRFGAVNHWTALALHLAWLGAALRGLPRSRQKRSRSQVDPRTFSGHTGRPALPPQPRRKQPANEGGWSWPPSCSA